MTARPLDGHLFAFGGGVLVCRHPLSTSLPIPLGVRAATLLTWAFAGLGDAAGEPRCLLVLSADGAAFEAGGEVTVETHFHDLAVRCPAPAEAGALSRADRDALSGAVLAALTRETLAPLSRLFPHLAPSFDALEPAADAPELTIAADSASSCALSGYVVPNHLLMSAAGGHVCARVASASLRFGAGAHAALSLERVWGSPSGAPPERALLIGADGVTPARLRKGAA